MAELLRSSKKEDWMGTNGRFCFVGYYSKKWKKMVKSR